VSDPNVRLGIRYDNRGVVVGYYVERFHPQDDKADDFEYDYFPRFDSAGQPRMLHIFDPLFAGQSRGLPWLLSGLNKIIDLDDYSEAEIIAKQVEACFGVIFKLATEDRNETMYDMANAASDGVDAKGDLLENLSPGFIQRLTAEDDVTTVNPMRPGNNFGMFMEWSFRQISAASQIPYELLAKNFFQTTFASGRLSVLDGQMYFVMRRSILEDMGLNPIHSRVVHTAVFVNELYGALPVGVYLENPYWFSRRKYYARQMGMIQPEREIKAYVEGKKSGFLGYADFHEERSTDWEAAMEQHKEEARRAIDSQLEIEQYEMEQRQKMGLPPRDIGKEGDETVTSGAYGDEYDDEDN
jgi:lambda family phage portal protein